MDDVPRSREEMLARLEAERVDHVRRSMAERAPRVVGGFVLGPVSLPLAVVLPELGVPLLLVALRLLAYEFAWAVRAYASVAWTWTRVKVWFAARPMVVQSLILLAAAAVALGIIALIV